MASTAAPAAPAGELIEPSTVKAWMDNGSAVVVDVREPEEFAREHIPGARLMYEVADGISPGMEPGSFTHSLAIHPMGGPEDRAVVLRDLDRLLLPGGQAVVSLPVRGSFPEVNDMLREFALRQDLPELGKAVDAAIANRPTIETLSEELETAGLRGDP